MYSDRGLSYHQPSQYIQPNKIEEPETKLEPGDVYDDLHPDSFTISGQGYTACVYVFLEGLVLLPGVLLPFLFYYKDGPFAAIERSYLWVVGIGDVLFSIVGCLGIYLSRNLVPLGWRKLAKWSHSIAAMGTGSILVWRSLVLVSFAPWAGFWLAFEGSHAIQFMMYLFILAYLFLSMVLVFIFARVFRQTVTDSLGLQSHLDEQAVQERKSLLHHAAAHHAQGMHADGEHGRDHELEPDAFGCLPLAPAVAWYAGILLIACVLGFLWILFTGHSVGGWAFFAEHPKVSITFWLEFFLYLFSAVIAFVGVLGASSLSGLHSKFLPKSIDVSITAVLIFLLGNMLRYALLFAVTGMFFVQKNTCGIYVHGLAQIAHYIPSGFGLHCQLAEYFMLLLTLIICLMDGHLIWCTYQLWHHSQDWVMKEP